MTNQQAIKHLTQTAMVTALIIVLGFFPGIPVGFIPVPIILQNMGIFLAAELLGRKYGTMAVGLFLGLVALGLPLLSGGRGGAAVFLGPTGGYLVAWLLAPLLIGTLIKMTRATESGYWWLEVGIVWLAGILFIDVVGAGWLAIQSHMTLSAALLSNLAFIPGDLIKATLAVFIARRVRAVVDFGITTASVVDVRKRGK
ncbi:biotin transporter BioY [Lactiplantibacillus paraplantarum]|uniref:Biotin transporter n=1 Tax=Lactiplantibacillus paraplantarum TaxID=60520 RepID=A0ABQ0N9G4_9LACO|nr:biotin transporter BioY [Lactiplantibacillus paraplantarum]AVW09313.1 biotin transporter BioY [Lactiplantibacillus paraplantarum]ERL43727.1 integral membrane protein [Lactiplantibacillus paraplantarum]MCU4682534.1 biotin transporter BioY [Lactiplantibacillus paraplantarum]MDL2060703.1 biotin transporter BioY [Lactiplantibacillus paraplantarum]QJU50506.1 biotin transporter BioY [Lactiplantibacillus paraplantarum]